MGSVTQYPHLSTGAIDQIVVDGTRYKVMHLAGEHYAYGWSADELMHQHPDLKPEQVYAALTYFYDHFDEMVGHMQLLDQDLERRRKSQSISRAELLARRGQS